ncbi:DoxX family protein [Nocardia farcinica]|uniref:DoxX family protein n=1 Tax=Nocardia farcinica TaxID=37329 RepID=UPI001895D06E|nr:DoxX family protein [Nocardia farcinica]MBF6141068.1 DoxX family protein [Nocardia farcinica]MBF6536370.1 DoxX family protein [Nocardia farcinica]
MHVAYVVLTALAAAAAAFAAGVDLVRPEWVRANMRTYGIPDRALYPLAAVKAIGALGLLAGLVVAPVGLAAAIGLVGYFSLAVLTVLRARVFADVGYPLPYLAISLAALAVTLVAS